MFLFLNFPRSKRERLEVVKIDENAQRSDRTSLCHRWTD
jgi:hypothetical protein